MGPAIGQRRPRRRERSARRDLAEDLDKVLLSRDVIGQAKGILMERLNLSPEDAFEVLRRSSNRLNEKLHAVAIRLTEPVESSSGPVPKDGRSS